MTAVATDGTCPSIQVRMALPAASFFSLSSSQTPASSSEFGGSGRPSVLWRASGGDGGVDDDVVGPTVGDGFATGVDSIDGLTAAEGLVAEDGLLSTVDSGDGKVVVEAGSPDTAVAFEDVAVEDDPLPVAEEVEGVVVEAG